MTTFVCCFLFAFAVDGLGDDPGPPAVLVQRAEQNPGDSRANSDLGLAYFRLGRFREALPFLKRATVLDPSDSNAWKSLGLSFLQLHDYGAGVEPLQRACRLGADTCYLEGRALFLLERYDEAVETFARALKRAPKAEAAAIHRAMAMNFDRLGDASQAERHFSLALSLFHSGSSPAEDPRIEYGAFLVRHARAAEALQPLAEALAANPGSPRAHAEMGRALLDLDRPRDALPHFQKAIDLEPGSFTIRMQLGKTYLRLGRTTEGERELVRAREEWEKTNQGSSTIQ